MPSYTTLNLADGETTPVTHSFVPDGDVSPAHNRFINRNASVPAASEFLFFKLTRSTSSQQDVMMPGVKVLPDTAEIRFLLPKTYTNSSTGLVLVDYVNLFVYRRACHPRTSEQERKNGRTLMYNLLQSTNGINWNDKHEQFY